MEKVGGGFFRQTICISGIFKQSPQMISYEGRKAFILHWTKSFQELKWSIWNLKTRKFIFENDKA